MIGLLGRALDYWHNKSVNILKTLVINFCYLPFRQALRLPIAVEGPCRISLTERGRIVLPLPVRRAMVRIGESDPVRSAGALSYLNIAGTWNIGRGVSIRRGARINVKRGAELSMGSGVFVSDNTTIVADHSISIGERTTVGHDCNIIDTDFHYVLNIDSRAVNNNTGPVCIGANNWIGPKCFIKKNAATPEGTIVAGPFSMVGKDMRPTVEPYSIVGGCPAVPIKDRMAFVQNKHSENDLLHYFMCAAEPYRPFPDTHFNFKSFCFESDE